MPKSRRVDSWRDIVSLIIAYIKQETFGPLRGVGRFLAFGLGAATCFTLASLFFVLAMLRALQTETGSTFTGSLNWAPYLLTFLLSMIIVALAALAIGSTKRRRDRMRKRAA